VVNGSLPGSFGRIGVTWIADTGHGDFGNRARVTQHEMGHAWGLPHSNCADNAYFYTSQWDVMSLGITYGEDGQCKLHYPGYGCVADHTIAYHKQLLGWVTPFVAAEGTSATIFLENI